MRIPKCRAKSKAANNEAKHDNGSRGSASDAAGTAGEEVDTNEETEPMYPVEKILKKRSNKRLNCDEFLIKWQGYPMSECSWEPIENLTEDCKSKLCDRTWLYDTSLSSSAS